MSGQLYKMKTLDSKSWRVGLLLCFLLAVTFVMVPADDLIFAYRIRFGSADAKHACYAQLCDAMLDGTPMPHPWWTFSILLADKDPMYRIGGAKLRYALAPDDPRSLKLLIAETTNANAFIRGAALSEFWNMLGWTEQTVLVLERALFHDPDETVRRSAFTCLLPLSKANEQARSLLDRAAARHPIESTRRFAPRISHKLGQKSGSY